MRITIIIEEDSILYTSTSSGSSWWDDMTITEKKQYIRDHPQSKYAKNMRAIKKNFRRTKAKIAADIRSKVKNVHKGLGALKTVMDPRVSASGADKAKAKELLVGVAKVALVAGIVVGLTMGGVAPIARATADEFQDFLKTSYRASSSGFGEGTSSNISSISANGKQEDEELLKIYALYRKYIKTKTKKELLDLVKGEA